MNREISLNIRVMESVKSLKLLDFSDMAIMESISFLSTESSLPRSSAITKNKQMPRIKIRFAVRSLCLKNERFLTKSKYFPKDLFKWAVL